MTERPAERTSTRPPSTRDREDTVVRPAPGRTNGSAPAAPQPGPKPATRPDALSNPRPGAPAPAPAKAPKRSPKKATQKAAAKPSGRPGRRARLRLTRVDPWSVMKTAFLLSIALGIVTIVSVLMVWSVLGAADVWGSINQTVQDIVGGQDASNFDIEDYVGTSRVLGFTMIVAAIDVILLTAIATLGAFLYNMAASLLGGIEVTLAEDN